MKRWLTLLILAIQLVFAAGASAAVQVPPKPTSSIYVQDYAQVLSSQSKAAINAYSQDLDKKTTAQVVVVTIPSLDGQALEDYSLELMRQWGIGNKTKNNGVLLLVVVNDRQSRIEVGYGLEGALPDGLTGRIQDQAMLPYFKQGQYDKGINRGYANIVNTVAKEYNVQLDDIKSSSTGQEQAGVTQALNGLPWWQKLLLAVGLAGLLLVDQLFFGGIILHTILLMLMRGGGRGGGGGGFGGGGGGGGGSSRKW
ncbi:MAG: TPM domain-containing protein [Acidaminococcaceae bacterium]